MILLHPLTFWIMNKFSKMCKTNLQWSKLPRIRSLSLPLRKNQYPMNLYSSLDYVHNLRTRKEDKIVSTKQTAYLTLPSIPAICPWGIAWGIQTSDNALAIITPQIRSAITTLTLPTTSYTGSTTTSTQCTGQSTSSKFLQESRIHAAKISSPNTKPRNRTRNTKTPVYNYASAHSEHRPPLPNHEAEVYA